MIQKLECSYHNLKRDSGVGWKLAVRISAEGSVFSNFSSCSFSVPLEPLHQLPPTPIASASRGCYVEEEGAERVFPDLVLESSDFLFSWSVQVCEVMIALLGCTWRLCGSLEWGPQRSIYSRLCNLTIFLQLLGTPPGSFGLFLLGLLVTPGSLIEKDPR